MTTPQERATLQTETNEHLYLLEETLNGGVIMAISETIMLNIKFLEFLALELAVVAVIGVALFAGVYQIVRERRRQAMGLPGDQAYRLTRV